MIISTLCDSSHH